MNKKISFPLAILIIIVSAVIVGGGVLGYVYYSRVNTEMPQIEIKKPAEKLVACTQKKDTCSNGSNVGLCIFASCPPNTLFCKENSKYFVISTENILSGNSYEKEPDFLVKYKTDKNQKMSCDYIIKKTDFEIKNRETFNFLALTDNFLVLDSGTAPEPRGIHIYDLDKREKIYDGLYSSPINASGDILTYWEPINKTATIENCPKITEWTSSGLGAEIETFISFDLSTLVKKELGEYRCSPTQ